MKNASYFNLKALFVFKILKFLSCLFGHVGERLDQEDQVNFKIYDVTTWSTNNLNKHIYQYFRSKGNQAMKFGKLIEQLVQHEKHFT